MDNTPTHSGMNHHQTHEKEYLTKTHNMSLNFFGWKMISRQVIKKRVQLRKSKKTQKFQKKTAIVTISFNLLKRQAKPKKNENARSKKTN
jgi:hypothetical protein